MPQQNNLDWKTYESITKYIYETLDKESGVKIEGYGSKCKIKGKSGVQHQIDVLTSHSDGINLFLTAIECKYCKEKVNKEIVMKLAGIIDDCGFHKGVIVSKNGFTKDGVKFAKHKNIELVELRKFVESESKEISKISHLADVDLQIKTSIKRTEILKCDIGDNRIIEVNHELEYYNFNVIMENGCQISLYDYIIKFRKEVNPENKKTEKLTKHYHVPNGVIYNTLTKETFNINGVTLIGQLRVIKNNKNLIFNIVDQVWLIMKSIFDERTFTFNESGLIQEHKK
jgi:hypothetical protein